MNESVLSFWLLVDLFCIEKALKVGWNLRDMGVRPGINILTRGELNSGKITWLWKWDLDLLAAETLTMFVF
jgi:hypothetical protein